MKPFDQRKSNASATSDDRLHELAQKFRAEIDEINAQEQAEFADWQRERRRWLVHGGSSLTSFSGDGGGNDCGGDGGGGGGDCG